MTSTPPLDAEIHARLTAALDPVVLHVINTSHQHAGHAGDDGSGETHWVIVVASARFIGLSRIERQRLVNHALADLLSSRIHALEIRARAPNEVAPAA